MTQRLRLTCALLLVALLVLPGRAADAPFREMPPEFENFVMAAMVK